MTQSRNEIVSTVRESEDEDGRFHYEVVRTAPGHTGSAVTPYPSHDAALIGALNYYLGQSRPVKITHGPDCTLIIEDAS